MSTRKRQKRGTSQNVQNKQNSAFLQHEGSLQPPAVVALDLLLPMQLAEVALALREGQEKILTALKGKRFAGDIRLLGCGSHFQMHIEGGNLFGMVDESKIKCIVDEIYAPNDNKNKDGLGDQVQKPVDEPKQQPVNISLPTVEDDNKLPDEHNHDFDLPPSPDPLATHPTLDLPSQQTESSFDTSLKLVKVENRLEQTALFHGSSEPCSDSEHIDAVLDANVDLVRLKLENLEDLSQYVEISSHAIEGEQGEDMVIAKKTKKIAASCIKTVKQECCLCKKGFLAESVLHAHIRRVHQVGLVHYESYKAQMESGASIDMLGLSEKVMKIIKDVDRTLHKRKRKVDVDVELDLTSSSPKRKRGCSKGGAKNKATDLDEQDNLSIDATAINDGLGVSVPPKSTHNNGMRKKSATREGSNGSKKKLANVVCSLCGYPFDRLRSGLDHLQHKHLDGGGYIQAVQKLEYDFARRRWADDNLIEMTCPVCHCKCVGLQVIKHLQKWHADLSDLTSHMNACHQWYSRLRVENYKARNPDATQAVPCEQCGKMVKRINMPTHNSSRCPLRANKKKKIPCHFCRLSYASKELLEEHVLQKHPDGQPKQAVCEICGQHFPRDNSLTVHRIRKHNVWLKGSNCTPDGGEPGVKCDVCDKWFPFRTQLTEHMTVHTDARPFPCDVCEKTYKSRSQLRYHRNTVHHNKYRYRCEWCGHGVMRKEYLSKHLCGRVRRKQSEASTTKHMKEAGSNQMLSNKNHTAPVETKLPGSASLAEHCGDASKTSQHHSDIKPHANNNQDMLNVIPLFDRSIQNRTVKETESNMHTLTLTEALKHQVENMRVEATQLFELDEGDVVRFLPPDSVGLLKTSSQNLKMFTEYNVERQDAVVIENVKVEAIPQTGDMQ